MRHCLIRLRHDLNWLNGSTLLGLILARLGRARISRGPDRLILAESCRIVLPDASAFTIGDVLLTGSNFTELSTVTPRIIDHEARHAWQYAVCGGFFWPLYGLGLVYSWIRTGQRGAGHPFERLAGLTDGGYQAQPYRSWTDTTRILGGLVEATAHHPPGPIVRDWLRPRCLVSPRRLQGIR